MVAGGTIVAGVAIAAFPTGFTIAGLPIEGLLIEPLSVAVAD
jgi:hypothetical protein